MAAVEALRLRSGQAQVDQAASDLWGITERELKEIRRSLAELGLVCTQKVAEWLQSGGPGKIRSIGKLRSMVLEMLAEELGQIDELVEPMLRAGAQRSSTWYDALKARMKLR